MKEQNIWLLDEYEERKKRNPRYSLRSFANSLGISAGVISKAFNGENSISLSTATKILEKLSPESDENEKILAKYEELEKKEQEIKKRLKRILSDQKEQSTKYLNADEFLTISDWRFTFLFYLLDLLPSSQTMTMQFDYLETKSGFSRSEIEKMINSLQELDLVTVSHDEARIIKNYDRFLFQGRENEASIDKIRVSFAESSKYLSETGAMSVYPREINGELVRKSSSLTNGINLVNWDFFVLDKNTAFTIEKIIENMYEDINRISNLEELNNAEVYCMSSQFFKASNS